MDKSKLEKAYSMAEQMDRHGPSETTTFKLKCLLRDMLDEDPIDGGIRVYKDGYEETDLFGNQWVAEKDSVSPSGITWRLK